MHGKSSREGDRKGVSQWRVCVVRPSAIGHQILPGNLLGTSAKHYLLLSQLRPKELGYWYPNPVCLWQRTAPADEGVNSPALRSAKPKCCQKDVGTVHFEMINMRKWRWDVNNVTQLIYFFCKLLWVEFSIINIFKQKRQRKTLISHEVKWTKQAKYFKITFENFWCAAVQKGSYQGGEIYPSTLLEFLWLD